MRIISHRGNLTGADPNRENYPDQIKRVLETTNYDVEIDIWRDGSQFYLGHDLPKYLMTKDCLLKLIDEYDDRLWLHCKNLEALNYSTSIVRGRENWFWHENDSFTLTSNRLIWTYPGRETTENSVIVLPNILSSFSYNIYGICTDFPDYFSAKLQHYTEARLTRTDEEMAAKH